MKLQLVYPKIEGFSVEAEKTTDDDELKQVAKKIKKWL